MDFHCLPDFPATARNLLHHPLKYSASLATPPPRGSPRGEFNLSTDQKRRFAEKENTWLANVMNVNTTPQLYAALRVGREKRSGAFENLFKKNSLNAPKILWGPDPLRFVYSSRISLGMSALAPSSFELSIDFETQKKKKLRIGVLTREKSKCRFRRRFRQLWNSRRKLSRRGRPPTLIL